MRGLVSEHAIPDCTAKYIWEVLTTGLWNILKTVEVVLLLTIFKLSVR